MAMQPVALETGIRDGAGRGLTRWLRRPGIALGVLALALAVAGDRSRAASVPAAVLGQDPLEVLELKVRPNVIVVLDSSGSMTGTVGTEQTNSGDHPRSRFYQAKQVMKTVVQANLDKVSFQFGTYTQLGMAFNNQAATTSGTRFRYWTTDQLTPTMVGSELTVQGAYQDSLGRGLQSWQIIQPQWGSFYFDEDASGSGPVDAATCTATLTGLPKFYARGGSGGAATALSTSTAPQNLSFELQTAINGVGGCAGGGSRTNTYRVTYDTTNGRFSITRHTGTRQWRILWAQAPNNIRNALAETNASTTTWQTTATINTDAPWRLLYRNTATSGAFGSSKWTELVGATTVTNYQLTANRLWNGEVIRVQSDGMVCGMTFPTAAEKTNPPSMKLRLVAANCGTDQAQEVTLSYAGADFSGNSVSCRGFRSKSSLIPCDLQSPPAPLQTQMIGPFLDTEVPFAATGDPADWTTNGAAVGSAGDSVPDGVPDYVETQDGSWAVQYVAVAPSAKADGATPIANSLIDIRGAADGSNSCLTTPAPLVGKKDSLVAAATIGACVQRGFTELWQNGQAGSGAMAGPAPWAISAIRHHGMCPDGTTYPTPCATQRKPKEKTIVLFVTDGDDTCFTKTGTSSGDPNAMRAAYWAARLYQPIDPADSASSVNTYVIGYGNGATPNRLNWIAWGGSGLGQGAVGDPLFVTNDGNQWTETSANVTTKRARCSTCVDAFIAPDAPTLASQLQGIIDQGASDGDFNAQQSITESVFEDVAAAPATASAVFDPAKPSNRYKAIVPTRFVSSFSLPGFKGQQKAYQNDGAGNPVLKWSAGDVLWNQVSTAFTTCNTAAQGGAANECVINQLHGAATDANIRTSAAKIKRRIYTTNRNGVYPYTLDTLMDGTSANRVTLWPPAAGMLPASYTAIGPYDAAMGLPPDAPAAFPPNPVDPFCDPLDLRPSANPKKPFNQCWFEWMQKRLFACTGTALPAACTAGGYATRMQAARRESRDIILAFLAGGAVVPDPTGVTTGIKRSTAAIGAAPASSVLFKARPWILGDSELATSAVITPPLPADLPIIPINARPAIYLPEYVMFADGPRGAGAVPDSASPLIKMGFGLRAPDDDGNAANNTVDTRPNLKPVMTVLYAPANDMLHAFRAGACGGLPGAPCNSEAGGEELWGFVPYDQLHTVLLRAAHEPQGKNNHVYSLARGARFADVFVPGSFSRTVSGLTVASTNGVWRRILYIGRGIGGKYLTALDVTAPGPYTGYALDTTAPVPLWSRGNPDTQNGLVGGTPNGTGGESTAYSKMGETWSMPTVAYVDKNNAVYQTPRRPAGLDHVIFVGSGYGNTTGCPGSPCEGQTFYTLDALSGDVVATADVGSRSGFGSYANSLVANAVGFQPKVYNLLGTVHPSADTVKRVYIGDVHGRLWKFLTSDPGVALLASDLGDLQPIGTAVSLLGLPAQPNVPTPYVFVTSGADKRTAGPFRVFAFRDDGADTDTAVGAPSTDDGVTTFAPMAKLFARTFDQGTPDANCGYPTEAFFRGTVQPAAAFECMGGVVGGQCIDPFGRVFFAGTRLSLPNTKFAPVTPLACGSGVYPCRSQFDSTIYVLGAETGLAAYDLNSAGDDAYRIFRDSRIAAISMQSDPDPAGGGSKFVADEGLMKGTPKPPPPPGVPPTSRTNSRNVVITREAGQPAPTVRYGSTVCQ